MNNMASQQYDKQFLKDKIEEAQARGFTIDPDMYDMVPLEVMYEDLVKSKREMILAFIGDGLGPTATTPEEQIKIIRKVFTRVLDTEILILHKLKELENE